MPLASAITLILVSACGKAKELSPDAAFKPEESAKGAPEPANTPALAQVNDSLKSGAFDDAAARLLELQASGRNFTQREATEYRRALNDAYTKALEAADRGDKRAEAAIKMIRASSPH